MNDKSVRDDLEFLVKSSKKSLGSTYHDAGSCCQLIEMAVKEIRKLRKQLGMGRHKRTPPKP